MPNPSLRTPLRASPRTLRVGLVAAVALCASSSALAQTVLKIGYTPSKESHYGVGATAFCDEVEKSTQGRYKCQQFPSSALGGEREQIEAVQLGTQDLVITSTGPVGNFVPEIKIVDIPFLFRDYEHARKVLDGPIGQDILTKFPAKGHHRAGLDRERLPPHDQQQARHRQARGRRGPEDAHHGEQGAHGRLPHLRHPADADGLPRGVRRAAAGHGRRPGEPDPGHPVAPSSAQVQKHLSLTGHVYSPALLLMSPQVWNKLSDADKKVFLEAAKVSAAAQRKKVNDDDEQRHRAARKGRHEGRAQRRRHRLPAMR